MRVPAFAASRAQVIDAQAGLRVGTDGCSGAAPQEPASSTGLAGLVRLADMIARFEAGNPVETMAMQVAAADVGLELPGLRAVLSAEPPAPERRSLASCPLTAGELRVVSKLAKGRVYKEIAAELDLAVSTVRTHLYNTYRKLGVPDRAHAILLAKENSDASRCRIAGLKRSTSELDLGARRPRATPKRD